jgi:putative AlgH/UPF0301 family transcriptional regulator
MKPLLLFLMPLAICSFVLLSSPSWGRGSPSSRRKHHIHKRRHSNLDDWRDFRTKLIQSNSNNTSKDVVLDTGYLIEAGSIVLSEVESSLGCHDLNQPYLHKAVVLLLEHDDDKYTKGVLLNRQTDLILADDDIIYLNENGEPIEDADEEEEEEEDLSENDPNKNRWRMNFGGDLAGLYDENPAIVCLHSLTSSALAKNVSETVMPGIFYTSHASARLLISLGEANTSDFFVCFGFCGWDPGQLRQELKRGSWSMVSTTSADTIWKELQQQQQRQLGITDEQEQQPLVVVEPRTAGLQMWESFRKKVGKDPTIGQGSFSDLMLKEW